MSRPAQIDWRDPNYPECGYRPGELMEVPCIGERCKAWGAKTPSGVAKGCRLIQ